MSSLTPAQEYLRRHYRWNFSVNVLDGGFFIFGINFVSTVSVLPLFVYSLTDSPFAIGLIPAIFQVGWLMPQLLTARHVEGLNRNKPFVMLASSLERFQWLALVPAVLAMDRLGATTTLLIFYGLFSAWTIGGGLTATAWQNLIATIIPPSRIGLFFGMQTAVGGLTGAGGAVIAGRILQDWPYPNNFAACFFIAGLFMVISYVFLGLTREPVTDRPLKQQVPLADYLRYLRTILRAQPNYARFLLGRSASIVGGMHLGFISVYAVSHYGITNEEIGVLTAVLLVAQTVGNLIWGVIGDRRGHKLVMESATLVWSIAALVALLAPSSVWLYLVFALLGIGASGSLIAGLSIVFDFAPEPERPTYIGLTSTLIAIPSGVAPLLGSWLAAQWGYPTLFGVACVAGLIGYGVLRWAVVEPRRFKEVV